MASATHTLKEEDETNVVYTLVGQNENGALYKDATRELGVPRELQFSMKIGNPQALGNDQIISKLRNTVENSTTGKKSTGSVSIVLSVPRDSAWTNQMSEDLLIQLQDLFTDANSILLADGIVP